MARIQVNTPFMLLDVPTHLGWVVDPSQKLRFATTGVYDVTSEVAAHPYVANFATVVDPGTPATATFRIEDF